MSFLETVGVQKHFHENERGKESNWLVDYIKGRLKANMDTRILVTGPGGIGKSWLALKIGELVDPRFRKDPEGAVEEQICFKAENFMGAIRKLPTESVVIYDEPGQTFFSREFMSEANRLIAKTMIGFRMRKLVTMYAIPAISLIDKAARVLCTLKIDVLRHGYAEVQRIMPSRFYDDIWYKTIGTLRVYKPRPKLRKLYEAKKYRLQMEVYTEYERKLRERKQREMSDAEIMSKILEDPKRYRKVQTTGVGAGEERYHLPTIQAVFSIGRERSDRVRALLRLGKREK